MHTHTFTSRFNVGDKITDGNDTFTISGVGRDTSSNVYYKLQDPSGPVYYESELTRYHIAPKYPVGSRVWILNVNEIREVVVTAVVNCEYEFKSYVYKWNEEDIFPTAEAARNSLKVIPLP